MSKLRCRIWSKIDTCIVRYCVRVNPDFNWFSLQQWVFDTSLQKIANVIPTAAVKQSAKVLGPLVDLSCQWHLKRPLVLHSIINVYCCCFIPPRDITYMWVIHSSWVTCGFHLTFTALASAFVHSGFDPTPTPSHHHHSPGFCFGFIFKWYILGGNNLFDNDLKDRVTLGGNNLFDNDLKDRVAVLDIFAG